MMVSRSKQKQTNQVTEAEKQVVEGIAAFRKLSRDISFAVKHRR